MQPKQIAFRGFELEQMTIFPKESSLDFLCVRIDTLLARRNAVEEFLSGNKKKVENHSLGHLEISAERTEIYWKSQKVDLPLTQFWMVEKLVANTGTAVSHDELMSAANIRVAPNTIAAHILAIRKHFIAIDKKFDAIRTERGLGYRWMISGSA